MKKLIMLFVLLFTVSITAQTTVFIVADTLGNSDEMNGYLNLDQFAPNQIDNIYCTLYSSGEIDLDSIAVFGGVKTSAMIGGAITNVVSYESSALAVEGTVTTNLADGVSGIDAGVPILTEALIVGYNMLKFKVMSAASGNDATDDDQIAILMVRVHTTAGK